MSMSDTAEYWWDVKAKRHYHGPTFRHAHGYDCSHLKWCNNRVTKYLLDVNCHECVKAIGEGLVQGLLEGNEPPHKTRKKKKNKKTKALEQTIVNAPSPPTVNYGSCPKCGSGWRERTNSKTGEKFLGCSKYPNCKTSKPL